jgi:hypothetical protein
MPNLSGPPLAYPLKSFPGAQAGVGTGVNGELLISELLGKYATLSKSQKVFYTSLSVTAPVIFSTAGQLGPMLWNKPGSGVDAHILGISVGQPSTATSVGGSIGYASCSQPLAPTTPTAIVAVNAYAGGGPSQMGAVLGAGTVNVLPAPIYFGLTGVGLAAVTTGLGVSATFVDVGGVFIVGPGNCGYVCANATQTSGVFNIGLLWCELPV